MAAHQAGLVLTPPRLEVERADGSWATAIAEIGIPVGRPQTIVVDLADRLGPSRRGPRRHQHARLLGPGAAGGAGGRSTAHAANALAAARLASRARVLRRGEPGRPRALGLRLRARGRALHLEDDARPLHAGGRRAAAARRERRPHAGVEARRRGGAELRRARARRDPARLDADLPAARRRLQQGDGPQLGEPRRRAAAAVPRHEGATPTPTPMSRPGYGASSRKPRAGTRGRWSARSRRSSCLRGASDPLFGRGLPDGPPQSARPGGDEGEHRPHAVDDRHRARRSGAVPARAARRLPRVRPRRARLPDARGAAAEARGRDPERAHGPRCTRRRRSTASTSRAAR